MCDPKSLGMSALSLGGSGLSLYGASRQARGALDGGQFSAQQSLLQSQIAAANARMAMLQASGRMGVVDRRAADVIGNNRADAAARGLAPDHGSPLLNQAYVAAQANIDKQLLAAQGFSDAASAHYQSMTAALQGREALAAARQNASAAWLGGIAGGLKSLGGLRWGGGVGFGDRMTLASFPSELDAGWN